MSAITSGQRVPRAGRVSSIRDLTALSDRNGNRISILRHSSGTPIGIEHPGYRLAIGTAEAVTGPRIAVDAMNAMVQGRMPVQVEVTN